jgi:hypothetical protein
MVVFDYDEQKSYQKCFSYSSPKHDDSKIDLRYFILPTKTKIMLNVPIDIPTAYLIKVNFHKMIEKENNSQIKKNLMDNITNLNHVNHYRNEILEQYEVIYKNIWSNPKFHKNNVQWAHDRMISDQKQHMFCEKEIQLIKQRELLLNKSKQNEPGGGSSGAPNDENRTSVQVYKE